VVDGVSVDPGVHPIMVVIGQTLTWPVVLRTLCVLSLVALLAWRNYAVGLWTEMSGKLWLRYAYPILLLMGISSFVSLNALYSKSNDAVQWSLGLAVVAWSLLIIRGCVALILAFSQIRSGLLSSERLLRLVGAHTLLCGVMLALVWYSSEPIRVSVATAFPQAGPFFDVATIGLAILWTPIVRIMAASQMLALNRHRA
jgi:hypothetical protein